MSMSLRDLVRQGTISSKDATIAGIMAGALVLVLLIFVLAVQVRLKIKGDALNASVVEKSHKLKDAKILAARKDELEAELEDVEYMVQRFEDKLPTRTEIPALYGGFQVAAEQASVKVDFIQKRNEKSDPTLVTVPYEISVYGNYHQLASFLNRLETGSRFMKVSKLHVGEQEDGVSNATFSLSTYLFREEGI